eukprot:2345590-Amphidinium_carterae.1
MTLSQSRQTSTDIVNLALALAVHDVSRAHFYGVCARDAYQPLPVLLRLYERLLSEQSAAGQCAGHRFSQWHDASSVPWARQGRHRRDGQTYGEGERRPHGPANLKETGAALLERSRGVLRRTSLSSPLLRPPWRLTWTQTGPACDETQHHRDAATTRQTSPPTTQLDSPSRSVRSTWFAESLGTRPAHGRSQWQEHMPYPNPFALVTRTCGSKTLIGEENSHRREPNGCVDEGSTRSQNQGIVQGSRIGLRLNSRSAEAAYSLSEEVRSQRHLALQARAKLRKQKRGLAFRTP